MKIRWKIFLLMLSLVTIIIGGFAFTNTVYLEKFYLTNKKEKVVEMAESIVDNKHPVDFRTLEMQNNAEIIIQPKGTLERFLNRGQLTSQQYKQIKSAFEDKTYEFTIINFEDYRGRSLVLFMPYREDRFIQINTPLSLISEGLEISVKYHLQIILLTLIVGFIISLIFSKAMVAPILQLTDITKNIAALNFEKKFEGERYDEVGQLGESINKMASQLQESIYKLNQVNAQLVEDIEKEKKIDNLRKKFIAYVSHELKTPIAIIQGYAQGLMENVATEDDKNFYCEIIIDEVSKMSSLVQELLLISKIETGYFKMNKEVCDFYLSIKDVIDQNNKKNATIIYNGPSEINVLCDEMYMSKVLENFVSNAIKYSTESKIIKIETVDCGSKYRFIVSNEYENMTEQDLEAIWTPFIRLEHNKKTEGHGLGLSIIAGLMQTHNNLYGAYLSKDNIINFWFELDKA